MTNKKGKITTIILAVLLCSSIVTLVCILMTTQFRQNVSSSVVIPGNIITQKPEKNRPFKVNNMLPGDSETKNYQVSVSYEGDIIVRYHADIRAGYEKLAEVLMVRVRLLDTDECMYDGLMRDMPESLNHRLETNKITQSELDYEITVYLDTSVGNEYQNCKSIVDFRWWVEEVENLNPANPSNITSLLPRNTLNWIIVILQAVLIIFIPFSQFCMRRKKVKNEK